MNNEEKFRRNRLRLAVFAVVVFVVLVVVAIILAIQNSINGRVIISGLDECLVQLRGDDRDSIQKEAYLYVKRQNEINGKETKSTYNATVRKDSCSNRETTIEKQGLRASSFILDIEDLNYSYRARFTYIPTSISKNNDSELEPDTLRLYCLDSSEMIYPDFGCDKNGLMYEVSDPIVYARGEVFNGCTISYTTSGTSKSGYAIILKYKPAGEEYSTFRPRCYEAAMNQIKAVGINPDNYYFYELDE